MFTSGGSFGAYYTGKLFGNIVRSISDQYKFELESMLAPEHLNAGHLF